MFRRNKLSAAIIAALAATHAPIGFAEIEEVTVTATKQSASTQDIPVAVSAVNEQTLQELDISNFDDYLLQLPGVTAGGSGPGQNTIYIRGVASTTPNLTTAGVAGLAPNVALYLDEQPLAQPGRNLDVYAADMNRIEVLSGPQGTLFGASSQAGTVRLITNKPDSSDSYGRLDVSTAITKDGDNSYNFELMGNMPLTDRLTVRGVVYSDTKGGFIDNVRGTLDASGSARFRPVGTVRPNGLPVSAGRAGFQSTADLSAVTFIAADNSALVEEDINETTYTGVRVSAAFDINDDWNVTVAHTNQDLESDGVFFADPTLGEDELNIQRYSDDKIEDAFHNTNWTIEGRIGELQVLYTGAYTERETDQIVDYADYMFVGQYLPYYICDGSVTYPGTGVAPAGTCQAPNLFVDSRSDTEVSTHEFRISTDQTRSVRVTAGFFYSDLELKELNSFTYPGSELAISFDGVTAGFGPNFSAQGATVQDTGVWPEGVIFRNDVVRTDEQTGFFGEASFDINEQFTATVGARWYDIEVELRGSAAGSFGNFGATTDNNAGNNLDVLFSGANPDTASTDGTIGKISLAWTPSNDALLYATWSQGYRPGLLNRPGGATNPAGTFTVPFALDTDDVVNIEAGWKLDLFDYTVRFNGSIFKIDIEQLQVTIFDPSVTNLFFSDNAADAEVTGIEGDLIWMPAAVEGLTVTGAFSILDSEITRVITPTNDVILGDELAFAPGFQGNVRARYEWGVMNGWTAHVMPQLGYSAKSYSDIITINRDEIDSWVMVGLTAGISAADWTAEFFVDNLTDERAELSRNLVFDRERVTYSRPRTMGVRLSYNF